MKTKFFSWRWLCRKYIPCAIGKFIPVCLFTYDHPWTPTHNSFLPKVNFSPYFDCICIDCVSANVILSKHITAFLGVVCKLHSEWNSSSAVTTKLPTILAGAEVIVAPLAHPFLLSYLLRSSTYNFKRSTQKLIFSVSSKLSTCRLIPWIVSAKL